jgi:hypothetical protein
MNRRKLRIAVIVGVFVALSVVGGSQCAKPKSPLASRKSAKSCVRTIWPHASSTAGFRDGYVLWDGHAVAREFIAPASGRAVRGAFFVLRADAASKVITVSILAGEKGDRRIARTRVLVRAPSVGGADAIGCVSESMGAVGLVLPSSSRAHQPVFYFGIAAKQPERLTSRRVPFSVDCRLTHGRKYRLVLERNVEKPRTLSHAAAMSDYVFVAADTSFGSGTATTTKWRSWTVKGARRGGSRELVPEWLLGPQLLSELELIKL